MTINRFCELVTAAALGAVAGTVIGGFGSYVMDKARADADVHARLVSIRALALADCREEPAPCTSPRPMPRPVIEGGE